MAEFEAIKDQLQSFIRKYQLNLLLKGCSLFVLVALLFLLILVISENYFWFDTNIRLFLFISFIIIEFGLLVFFVGIPLLKVLDLKRAISDREAAILIGNYFPEIDDRLLNLIELKSQYNSEFLQAAIRQKSSELKFYNFKNAVSFGQYRRYMLWALIPVLLVLALMIGGKGEWLFNPLNRIKNYDKVYERPAPFRFVLHTNDLKVIEGDDYLLEVDVIGYEIPNQLKITIGDADYFLKQLEPGRFTYTFRNVTDNQEFIFKTNKIISRPYNLITIPVPELVDFNIDVFYPKYLHRENEEITGEGNLTIPEGTRLEWMFKHRNTQVVNLQFPDTLIKVSDSFEDTFHETLKYTLSTSNAYIENYQPLSFQLDIVKDKYPKIQVEEKLDSSNTSLKFYGGKISDDYGLSKLLLLYRKVGEEKFQSKSISFNSGNVSQFYTSFPGDLILKEGDNYEYFFKVFDNDAVNGRKSASSEYFTYYNKTSEEINDQELKDQEESIDNLQNQFEKFRDDDELNNLLNEELENKEFDYEQKQKLESFIKSQERENELMEKFSKQIRDKLKDTKPKDKKAKNLKERLQSSESKLEDNKKLLEELKEYSDKIKNESLQQKLQKLSRNKKSSKRSLEQLVELTKQFYIEQKYKQIVNKLDRLGEEQKELDSSKISQEDINKRFDEIKKELNQLGKRNEELKRPKSLERDKESEEAIKNDLNDLNSQEEELNNPEKKSKQQKAGQKMKDLASKMRKGSSRMEMQTLDADIEALRKVLDNLVIFSFEQENLMKKSRNISTTNPEFSSNLKAQYVLKENFEHVDDSLFSLGLKNEFIAEKVFDYLEDVSFNLDKSLKELSEVHVSNAVASQRYAITGANDLAVLLNDILDNMSNQMNASEGGGEGKGLQLQDIIQKQQDLGKKIQEQKGNGKGEKRQQQGEKQQSELFEIYKKQEEIRQNLKNLLKQNGINLDELNQDYDALEKDILNDDINQNSLNTLDRINQRMLDLKQSLNEKGTLEERESKTNNRRFDNQSSKANKDIKDYFNSIEILDRQALPLRPNLKERVNTYFNE